MTEDIVPDLIVGFQSRRIAGNVLHTVIGTAAPTVTLRPATLRSGVLTLLFADQDAAFHCEAMHAEPGIFTVYESTAPWATMTYVVAGDITADLDPDTQSVWFVTVAFQEVLP